MEPLPSAGATGRWLWRPRSKAPFRMMSTARSHCSGDMSRPGRTGNPGVVVEPWRQAIGALDALEDGRCHLFQVRHVELVGLGGTTVGLDDATVSLAADSSRSLTTTWAPSCRQTRRAPARPMPEPAAVTMATATASLTSLFLFRSTPRVTAIGPHACRVGLRFCDDRHRSLLRALAEMAMTASGGPPATSTTGCLTIEGNAEEGAGPPASPVFETALEEGHRWLLASDHDDQTERASTPPGPAFDSGRGGATAPNNVPWPCTGWPDVLEQGPPRTS